MNYFYETHGAFLSFWKLISLYGKKVISTLFSISYMIFSLIRGLEGLMSCQNSELVCRFWTELTKFTENHVVYDGDRLSLFFFLFFFWLQTSIQSEEIEPV